MFTFTNRGFPRRWQARRPVGHQAWPRTARVLYQTAWADAWPHLDDWFKTEVQRRLESSVRG
jgi:hypothetical protein